MLMIQMVCKILKTFFCNLGCARHAMRWLKVTSSTKINPDQYQAVKFFRALTIGRPQSMMLEEKISVPVKV